MPPEERPVTDVRFTPEFKRNPRHLARKYRHIRSDVQPIVEQLELGGRSDFADWLHRLQSAVSQH